MVKEAYVTLKTKLSFIDKIKFSLRAKKPESKGIVEQAEKIVEEYILNCRLQGITLYKKRKKLDVKKAAAVASVLIGILAVAYLIFV